MPRSLSLAASACLLLGSLVQNAFAQSVDPIVIKGSKFFYKTNGTQFYIKGIAYQQDFSPSSPDASSGYVDPLADPAGCKRDIPYLIKLATNTIRVYAVDPTKDHTDCMNQMAAAGIYVMADLGSPDTSIDSNNPAWTTDIYMRYTQVIDALAPFSNTLGFLAGNEVVNQPNQTIAAPFVKAAARDMKAYIKSKNYRPLGVGYASTDNPYIRITLPEFLDCGSNADDSIDFFGYNVYSWCGDATFESSGYNERVQQFQGYNIPTFFAEYGCINPKPRLFTEVPVLFGPQMDGVFSGGFVYLYFQTANNYGLVQVDTNDNTVSTFQDFDNLSKEIATVSPTIVTMSNYSPTNNPQACPTMDSNFSAVASPLPPTPDTNLCQCMYSSLGCVVSSDVAENSYEDLFNYVCGLESGKYCAGIAADATSGRYGNFEMCNSTQKLGYVLNQYYVGQGSSASACAFSGSAMTVAAATPSGSCSSQLAAASSNGGTVPSGGSGGSGGSASSSKGAAGFNMAVGAQVGVVWASALTGLALISGVGMVLL